VKKKTINQEQKKRKKTQKIKQEREKKPSLSLSFFLYLLSLLSLSLNNTSKIERDKKKIYIKTHTTQKKYPYGMGEKKNQFLFSLKNHFLPLILHSKSHLAGVCFAEFTDWQTI
jgi:hypothetical protein